MIGRARAVFRVSPPWLTLVPACLLAACPTPEPACPDGQVEDTESGQCVPEHCGSGPWGLLERTGETVHVAPWGDDGWDGSQEWPHETIQKGADEAEHMVAVAAGTYVENLRLDDGHDGVEIAGRCAELVVVDGSGDEGPGVLVTGGELLMRSVMVSGGTGGIVLLRGGGGAAPSLGLEDVTLEGNSWLGLAITDAQVHASLEDVVIRDTRAPPDGTGGAGIAIQSGASLTARGLLLEGNQEFGLYAWAATVDLQDATVRATQPREGLLGMGISAQHGSSLIARGVLLEGNHQTGLFVALDATVELEDATIRDTQPLPDVQTGGRGIEVQTGASLLGRRLLLEGNHEVGLLAISQASVDLEDVTIRGTQPQQSEGRGGAVSVEHEASLVASNLLLEGNHEVGLLARTGAIVSLEDATIRDTRPVADGTLGRGIDISGGASLVARGLHVEGNHEVGLLVRSDGTTADLADATIRDTQPTRDGTRGRGIHVAGEGGLVAHGLLLEGNHEVGLLGVSGADLALYDVTIRDTRPLAEGSSGRGIELQGGTSLVADGLLLDGNHEVGLLAVGEATTVEVQEATVRDTQPRPGGTFGRGIHLRGAAGLVARDLVVEGNHDVGLFAADEGTTVDLEDVTVRGTTAARGVTTGIGVVVQLEAALAATDLRAEDNEGPGLYVVASGTLDAEAASLVGNVFSGAVVSNARLELRGGEVSGSASHPAEGGGVGLFAWDLDGPADLEVQAVSFSDLVGPALYLRGPGRYVMRDCQVTDAGSSPRSPGGVMAIEGVEPWHEVGDSGSFTGLLLQGDTFDDLPSDALLLDSSSITLDLSPENGGPNTFGVLGGVPLVWQRCDDVEAPEIEDGSLTSPVCEPVPRTLGPALEYRVWLAETEPVE